MLITVEWIAILQNVFGSCFVFLGHAAIGKKNFTWLTQTCFSYCSYRDIGADERSQFWTTQYPSHAKHNIEAGWLLFAVLSTEAVKGLWSQNAFDNVLIVKAALLPLDGATWLYSKHAAWEWWDTGARRLQ